jgi:hypothetical protein
MPNSTQYRTAAQRFRTLRDVYAMQSTTVDRWPLDSILGPSPVADVLVEHLDTSAAELAAASRDLDRLAQVCDSRAVVCEDYERRLADYHRRSIIDQLFFTDRPERPYPWVS